MSERLKHYAALTETRLNELLPPCEAQAPQLGDIPPLLSETMRYSLLAGGKRLRPAFLLGACEMLGGSLDEALTPACAVEMIHTYSLIHDDLPGMDNDTLRRGRPTNHVVYGEGQAILAGDGLLSYAFECLTANALAFPEHAHRHLMALSDIARGAGVRGMVAGQCLDLWCAERQVTDSQLLRYIEHNKTAELFIAPLRAGAHLAGADDGALAALSAYGRLFGQLFQVVDDILDVVGDAARLGKSTGKDESSGKLTAVSQLGLEGARALSEQLAGQALAALAPFGARALFFSELLAEMTHRAH